MRLYRVCNSTSSKYTRNIASIDKPTYEIGFHVIRYRKCILEIVCK